VGKRETHINIITSPPALAKVAEIQIVVSETGTFQCPQN
jgi:hypothetical protein